MKLTRKGIWWFGWVEKHKMTVVAQPVTDRANGGKGENLVELVGKRWRLFPAPAFIIIPLLFLGLLLLGSGATHLIVTNAIRADSGDYFVFGDRVDKETGTPSNLAVHLAWDAPIYAVIGANQTESVNGAASGTKSISVQRGKASVDEQVQQYGGSQTVTYHVGSKFTGAGEDAIVRFVPLRTDGVLQLQDSGQAPLQGNPTVEKAGIEAIELPTLEYTIMVPRDGLARINVANLSPVSNGSTVVLWTVKDPQDFQIQNFHTSGNSAVLNPAKTFNVKIKYVGSEPEGSADWELLTTDGKYRHIKIHLKVAG